MDDHSLMATTQLDLFCAQLAQDPWPQLRALQEQGSVVWHELHRRWLITSDRAVRQVALDFTRFTVEGTVVEDLFGAEAFIAMDDRSRHHQLRNVWAEVFRPGSIQSWSPQISAIVDRLLAPVAEALQDGAAVNVSEALCRPLPTLVIALLMGVPENALADVVRWSDALASGSTTFVNETSRQAIVAEREIAKSSLADFLLQLLQQRRRSSGEDLISRLVNAEGARGLSDDALVQNLRQLLFAGNETTAKWLDHAFLSYAQFPHIQRQLKTDRSLVAAANEEVLRWQGVVGTLPRRVRGGPVEVQGVTLEDGDEVTCVLACANRDPARYPNPDRFDPFRSAQPNLGFGIGLHNCLGVNLARLEVSMAVNGLLDRVSGYRSDDSVPLRYSILPLRGPTPVTIVMDDSR